MEVYHQSRDIFFAAGFNARQFSSNLREELQKVPEEHREPRSSHSLLGILWNTENDEFMLKTPKWKGPLTKRKALSAIATLFDPNGFVAPILLPAKLLQAELWELKSKWDDPAPAAIEEKWNELMQGGGLINSSFCHADASALQC